MFCHQVEIDSQIVGLESNGNELVLHDSSFFESRLVVTQKSRPRLLDDSEVSISTFSHKWSLHLPPPYSILY